MHTYYVQNTIFSHADHCAQQPRHNHRKFAFAMMIAILLFRPQGLFGSAESVEARV